LLCIAFCLFSCISEDKPKVSAGQIDTVMACPDENQVGINQIDTEITSKNKFNEQGLTLENKDFSDTTISGKPKYRYSKKDYKNIDPYLITNNGAGYFLLGGIISDFPSRYNYEAEEGEIYGVDADDAGGLYIKDGNSVAIVITYQYAMYDTENTKYANNDSDLFHVPDGNTAGWYYKNTIDELELLSPDFKTAEGIGVGSTIEEMKSKYDLTSNIYMVMGEELCALVTAKQYPNLTFEIDTVGLTEVGKKYSNYSRENKENYFDEEAFESDANVIRIMFYEPKK